MNLEDANRQEILGNRSLYMKLEMKFYEMMLTQYHLWVHDIKSI